MKQASNRIGITTTTTTTKTHLVKMKTVITQQPPNQQQQEKDQHKDKRTGNCTKLAAKKFATLGEIEQQYKGNFDPSG